MKSYKAQTANPATDQIAALIADRIVRWKLAMAAYLNCRINRCSKRQQRWLLVLFCALTCSGLMACMLLPYGKQAMKTTGNKYYPVHIGSPSETPRAQQPKPADSLTFKK